MASATKEKPGAQQTLAPAKDAPATTGGEIAQARTESFVPARLPYRAAIGEKFGIDQFQWKVLVESIFPGAQAIDSVVLAVLYCRVRRMDVMKRCVHIVPIWNKELGKLVDTVWPGIAELRTTAFRTNCYAGRSATEFGPDLTQKIGTVSVTFPEWAQVTVRRILPNGSIVDFAGPRVYWLETYAQAKRNDITPNSMWLKRVRGQIEKCAEAAALRAAFPEEVGNEVSAEEAEGFAFEGVPAGKSVPAIADGRSESEKLADLMSAPTTVSVEALENQIFDAKTPEDVAAAGRAVADADITDEQRAVLENLLKEAETQVNAAE